MAHCNNWNAVAQLYRGDKLVQFAYIAFIPHTVVLPILKMAVYSGSCCVAAYFALDLTPLFSSHPISTVRHDSENNAFHCTVQPFLHRFRTHDTVLQFSVQINT